MSYLIHFIPILSFILLFVGSGVYFTLLGIPNAFYQFSPITAIIPAIALAWLLHKGSLQKKMQDFLDGVRHRDIITMCIIFLLAGAFSELTKQIGSVDATVNFAISLIPSRFLLIGLFVVTAFVSTSIGTSMGAIATIAPIGFALSQQMELSAPLCVATVVGGVMFGDNLSIISDTTIASVMSQEANMKQKLKLNAKVALIASIITISLLALNSNVQAIAL
ncbi:MAG: Na+/H+ antiporter NhaC family protein [Candidatus Tisiphia sp.]